MTDYGLALLTCLPALAAALQTGTAPAAHGPHNGYFIPDGVGLKKPLSAEAAPLRGESSWTLHARVRGDETADGFVLLAGFGEPAGEARQQRFLAVRDGKLCFRSRDTEVYSEAALRHGSWQFASATFDGRELRLYADGASAAARSRPAKCGRSWPARDTSTRRRSRRARRVGPCG